MTTRPQSHASLTADGLLPALSRREHECRRVRLARIPWEAIR